jgi:hypothetical protein
VIFPVKYRNIQNLVVTVSGSVVTPVSIYAGAGQFQLAEAPGENALIVVEYEYAGFTDIVIASLIDAHSVNGAIIECLKDLLASASRRSDYTQGQTKVNASQVFRNLKDLLAMYSPGGEFSDVGGVSVGDRVHQTRSTRAPREDLSRSDNFSDNNVG